jgi:chorismate mutase
MALLTYEAVEAAVKNRVEMKTRNYGQEVRVTQQDDGADSLHKVEPTLVANLYKNWTMPLTKEVQVEYLLRRLD